jgi:Neuraminidase (sialidase)
MWSERNTTSNETVLKISNDNGKTFGPMLKLVVNGTIGVSWWERANQTSDEPVVKVSNDNGKTFEEKIMLSNNVTTAKPLL